MTRENILFSVVGLFFGYALAFTLVTYVNLHQGAPASAALGGAQAANLPAGNTDASGGGAEDPELKNLVQQAEATARQNPKDFDAQKNAAVANMQMSDFEGAIDFWLRAKELRPDDYETVVQLGNNNFEVRRYEAAERWYSEALTKKPDDVNVRTDLGLTYFLREQHDYDRAIAEYRKSLEINSRHEPTLQNLTIALVRKGNYKEAEATLKSLEQVNPINQALPTLRSELDKARHAPQTNAAPTSTANKGQK